VSDRIREDSIAEQLEGTRWDYSQRDDRRFLLTPIGQVFGTFRWDGRPDVVAASPRPPKTEAMEK
jgi:hypothetical protein